MKNSLIRWVLFLPTSIVITIIAGRLLDLINEISFSRIGIHTSSIFYSIYSAITIGTAYGCSFVYIGTFIVPKFKKQTALFLTITINLICIFLLIKYYRNDFKILIFFLMYFSISLSSFLTYSNIKNA
jgi:hypothetical protein